VADGVVRQIRYLGLAVEQGTANVPDDGKYYVTRDGVPGQSSSSINIALAYLEVLAEEVKAANPHLVDPADLRARERAARDASAIRAGIVNRTMAKNSETGGKGGRGGV
jgi:hypothetical protein